MHFSKLYLSVFIISVVTFSLSSTICFGQNNSSNSVESSFKLLTDSAKSAISEYHSLDETRKGKIENPEKLYADKFYEFYLDHPDTESGANALEGAFRFWLNADSFSKVKEVFPEISINRDYWADVAEWTRLTYGNNGATEDFIKILYQKEAEVKNTISKKYITRRLAEFFLSKNLYSQSKLYFNRLLETATDSAIIVHAQRNLYEINSLGIGVKAPNFTAKTIDGQTIELSNLKGKVVVLEFWAMWCGPCIPEIPYLKDIYSTFKDRDDFILIGVSLDEDVGELNKFLGENNMNWTQICEEERWNSALGQKYNANSGIPKSYIINKEGIIVYKDLRKNNLKEAISSLLDE